MAKRIHRRSIIPVDLGGPWIPIDSVPGLSRAVRAALKQQRARRVLVRLRASRIRKESHR